MAELHKIKNTTLSLTLVAFTKLESESSDNDVTHGGPLCSCWWFFVGPVVACLKYQCMQMSVLHACRVVVWHTHCINCPPLQLLLGLSISSQTARLRIGPTRNDLQ